MIKLTTLLIALLWPVLSIAQQTIKFTLPEDSVIKGWNQYKNMRVADMRKDTNKVGRISDAPNDNQFVKIITDKPLSTLLPSYFDKITGDKKGEFDMLLVLHDFEIAQRVYNSGLGYFHFSGDFYMGWNGKYALIDSVDALYQLSGPGFPQSLISFAGQHMYTLLNTYASKAVSRRWATRTERDAINRREQNKATHAIYKGNFKEGIYYTLDQFLKNEPSDTSYIFKEGYPGESKKLYNFWYKNDKGKKGARVEEKSFFAIYNSGTWYLGGEEYIKKMWYRDGEFITNIRSVGPKGYTEDMTNRQATAAGIGGSVGILVVAAVDKSREYTAPTIPVSYAARFDPATKKFLIFER